MTRKSFDETFIQEVMKRYAGYIENRCKNVSKHQIKDPVWGQDDIQQEIYIAVWRFCTKASKKYSVKNYIWLPSMEMMIRNVVTNLLEHRTKRADIFIDYEHSKSPESIIDETDHTEPYLWIDLNKHIAQVKKRIAPEFRQYFDEIINPSETFREFILANTPKNRSVKLTKSIVSKYFKIPYAKTLNIFKDLENSFEFCSQNK